jgi:hypothetical protein
MGQIVDFVVIACGELGDRITQLAREHAAYDSQNRNVVRYEGPQLHDATVAAVAIGRAGGHYYLNSTEATQAASVENAFVRAQPSRSG